MRYNLDEPQQEEIIDYIKAGITPRAIIQAYSTHSIRKLAKRCDVKEHAVTYLAERWGILGNKKSELAG